MSREDATTVNSSGRAAKIKRREQGMALREKQGAFEVLQPASGR
jgi:hypothetical protein